MGPVSGLTYYLYSINNPLTSVIRKINLDYSLSWMTSILSRPAYKSLSLDQNEQNVYFTLVDTPLIVASLFASSGNIQFSK